MADRRRDRSHNGSGRRSRVSTSHDLAASGESTQSLTAAAQLLSGIDSHLPQRTYETWQDEAWMFYESLGEFNYGVEWFGEAMSRVRLTAAIVRPGGDEPEPITDGPAADLVAQLVGGTDGQSQLLRSLGVQLSVPGDAYFIGREATEAEYFSGALLDAEPDQYGRVWTVQPANTVRRSRRTIKTMFAGQRRTWDVQVGDAQWVSLPNESLVCRIWDRNEHLPWRAMSPAKAALPIMREIDLYNRYIIATLTSRVALNGIWFIPDEIVLPASSQYEDASDPFVAELLDVMRAAIKNPGSPASAAPLPLRIPSEFIDKFKHFTFATPLDDKIFEHRDQALRRLATTLNLPAEIVTGMGNVNHWSSYQLEESAIKLHVSPKAEIITRGLTLGYLHPMLLAAGEKVRQSDGERVIIWYDTSELTQRPDRSGSAINLYRLKAINGTALRRETGFDESDAPSNDELETMILTDLAQNPQTAGPALKELTGLDIAFTPGGEDPTAQANAMFPGMNIPLDEAGNQLTGPPVDARDEPPPPDEGLTSSAARRSQIIRTSHSVRRRARMSVSRAPAGVP